MEERGRGGEFVRLQVAKITEGDTTGGWRLRRASILHPEVIATSAMIGGGVPGAKGIPPP